MEKRKKMREVEVGVWCDGGNRYSNLSGVVWGKMWCV